jgi:ribosomal protein S18 acetylase RimI-like enzyme
VNTSVETSLVIADFDNHLHRDQVVALWKNVFGYPDPHNAPELAIDKKLEVNDRLFFVAMNGDEVVGTIMAGYDGHRGWIYLVAVTPQCRRQNIGSRLVSHAEQALTSRGCVKINLEILQSNANVAAFYKSLGFSVENRITMGKRVSSNIP